LAQIYPLTQVTERAPHGRHQQGRPAEAAGVARVVATASQDAKERAQATLIKHTAQYRKDKAHARDQDMERLAEYFAARSRAPPQVTTDGARWSTPQVTTDGARGSTPQVTTDGARASTPQVTTDSARALTTQGMLAKLPPGRLHVRATVRSGPPPASFNFPSLVATPRVGRLVDAKPPLDTGLRVGPRPPSGRLSGAKQRRRVAQRPGLAAAHLAAPSTGTMHVRGARLGPAPPRRSSNRPRPSGARRASRPARVESRPVAPTQLSGVVGKRVSLASRLSK
jgi:hypothetical protein